MIVPDPMEFLREPEVCRKVRLSRVTRWRMEKEGPFPQAPPSCPQVGEMVEE